MNKFALPKHKKIQESLIFLGAGIYKQKGTTTNLQFFTASDGSKRWHQAFL